MKMLVPFENPWNVYLFWNRYIRDKHCQKKFHVKRQKIIFTNFEFCHNIWNGLGKSQASFLPLMPPKLERWRPGLPNPFSLDKQSGNFCCFCLLTFRILWIKIVLKSKLKLKSSVVSASNIVWAPRREQVVHWLLLIPPLHPNHNKQYHHMLLGFQIT